MERSENLTKSSIMKLKILMISLFIISTLVIISTFLLLDTISLILFIMLFISSIITFFIAFYLFAIYIKSIKSLHKNLNLGEQIQEYLGKEVTIEEYDSIRKLIHVPHNVIKFNGSGKYPESFKIQINPKGKPSRISIPFQDTPQIAIFSDKKIYATRSENEEFLKKIIKFPLPVYYIFSTQESQSFLNLGVENQLTAEFFKDPSMKKIEEIIELLFDIQKKFYPERKIYSKPVNRGYWRVDIYRLFICGKCKRIISNDFPDMKFFPNTKCPYCGGKILYKSERWNQ